MAEGLTCRVPPDVVLASSGGLAHGRCGEEGAHVLGVHTAPPAGQVEGAADVGSAERGAHRSYCLLRYSVVAAIRTATLMSDSTSLEYQ